MTTVPRLACSNQSKGSRAGQLTMNAERFLAAAREHHEFLEGDTEIRSLPSAASQHCQRCIENQALHRKQTRH